MQAVRRGDLVVCEPVAGDEHASKYLGVEARVNLGGPREQGVSAEPTRRDVDVGEVAGGGPVKQGEQLMPGELGIAPVRNVPAYDQVIASEDLLTALAGQRFDVVIEPVGGQVRTGSLKVMAPLGRMLLAGNASGDWQHTVATNDLWFGSLAVAGFNAGYYFPAHPGQARPAARGAIDAISQRLVDIRTLVFPLAEATEAHRRAEAGSAGGRILLAP